MSRASSKVRGAGQTAKSLIASTKIPPRPKVTTGPKRRSCRAPTITSLVSPSIISSTKIPSSRASGFHFWAFSIISSNANSTSSGVLRPNRITPASVLWSKSGEETFKTTGPAMSPAKDRASAALRAKPPRGTASPQAFSNSFASTSLKLLRP